MSSQLTRDARKSFRRRANIKLVCAAGPTSQSLNQMIRNAVASCYSGCPNAEAVAGEIALNSCGREYLPQPISKNCARQRLTTRQKEQGASWGLNFPVWRGMPSKCELRRGGPFPDQYGCGSLDGTDPFSKLLS